MYLWCLHEASQLLGIYGSVVLMKPAKALLRVGTLIFMIKVILVAFIKPAKALPWVENLSIHDQDSILVVFIKPPDALPWVAM